MASSAATTGNNILVNGPLVLYCLTISKVAAGAVEADKAPNMTHTIGSKPSNKVILMTNTTAKMDSNAVIIRAGLPIAFRLSSLN